MRLRYPKDWQPHRHPVNVRHHGTERTLDRIDERLARIEAALSPRGS